MNLSRLLRILKPVAIVVFGLSFLVALFLAAFVYNPFEGDVRDVRDIVPREVDFYVRKVGLRQDFGGAAGLRFEAGNVPEPDFWADMTDAEGWRDLQRGPLATGYRRDTAPQVARAVDALAQLQEQSGGFLDIARDAVGRELVVAGYAEDRRRQPPQPLQQPWWCVYARVSWRLRFAHGLMSWSMVQDQARAQGLEIAAEDGVLSLRSPQLREPLFLGRVLDCLMLANNKDLLLQSIRLSQGVEDEQPFGLAAQYTEGAVAPLQKWAEQNRVDAAPNALEFSVATGAFDGFRRFASAWPDAKNRDSMNERVLASFLNLRGWNSLTGAMVFEDDGLSLLGRVVLNSNLHTAFQSSFYRAEKQDRSQWLQPFLRMVPETACAAAALRMPAGEFLHAMFDALLQSERDMLDDALRRCTFGSQQLADTRDLIERLKIALLPRMGFVFRKNVPDLSRNEQGELYIPVVARAPVPQFAWVFWLRQDVRDPRDNRSPADDLVDMLRKYAASVFRFTNVYHLPVDGLPEQVTEFANPQIPGTGEIAAVVFRDFLVLSNSGPLIKDILRTRYSFGGQRSIVEDANFRRFEDELPAALNGFVWLRGRRLLSVLDDYRAASEQQNVEPDPDWLMQQRSAAEETVRRTRFPQYPSLASMPKAMLDGEFDAAVRAYLREQWNAAAAGFSAKDLPAIDQLRGMAQMFDAAYLQVELENNYIRFQGKAVPVW